MLLSSDGCFNLSSIWILPSLCGTRLRCQSQEAAWVFVWQLIWHCLLLFPLLLEPRPLLPNHLHNTSGLQDIFYITSYIEWQTRCNSEFPVTDKIGSQEAWDLPLLSKKLDEILSAAHTQAGHARLTAATALHSVDFLLFFVFLNMRSST